VGTNQFGFQVGDGIGQPLHAINQAGKLIFQLFDGLIADGIGSLRCFLGFVNLTDA